LSTGLVAWDGILKTGSSGEYQIAISKLDDCGLQEIAAHSYLLAGILRKKYRLLWLAIWLFICGGVLTVVLLFAIVRAQEKVQSDPAIIGIFPIITPAPSPPQQVPWWVEHLAVPIVFVILGAALGFSFGRLKDWLDNRKRKNVFLRAIRVELLVIRRHLEGTLKDATEARGKLDQGTPEALHLATNFQTGIYSSQVGKLNDVFDPLVIEVVQFYDSLMNLEKIKSRLTVVSFDLTTGTTEADKIIAMAVHYRSTLDEVIRRINQLLPTSDDLIRKLPT